MNQLQQAKLEVKPLLLAIAKFIEGPQHHLQETCEFLFREECCRSRCSSLFIGRDLQKLSGGSIHFESDDLRNDTVAQIAHELPRQLRGAVPCVQQIVCDGHHICAAIAVHRFQNTLKDSVWDGPHQLANLGCIKPWTSVFEGGRGDCLVHN